MKRQLLCIVTMLTAFIAITASSAAAKGVAGIYHVIFKMQDKISLKPICNAMFVVGDDTIFTDAQGRAEIDIIWRTVCPFRLSRRQQKRASDQLNGKYLYVIYNAQVQTVANKWREYGLGQARLDAKKAYCVTMLW
ncbi:MAG: hypothetical protein RL660_3049 [Bacteroidota bacterium]|jgi:hypothetical protein